MMDINETLNKLGSRREIFVSEADFQFALAWEIQKELPNAEVRLEYSPNDMEQKIHVDILIKVEEVWFPIELKYFTLDCNIIVDGEEFSLRKQGAQDVRRYDFLKDIMRIEKLLCSNKRYEKGYVVLLTNDPNYWDAAKGSNLCDADFRINEGMLKTGELKWADHTGEGTQRGRVESINLKGAYNMNWLDYSKLGEKRGEKFKVIIVEIDKSVASFNTFWIYENIPSKTAVIHKAECTHCNDGVGTQKNIHRGRNGKWHGRFKTNDEAEKFASTINNRRIINCGHCKPNMA